VVSTAVSRSDLKPTPAFCSGEVMRPPAQSTHALHARASSAATRSRGPSRFQVTVLNLTDCAATGTE
jgi:hypothetical protein